MAGRRRLTGGPAAALNVFSQFEVQRRQREQAQADAEAEFERQLRLAEVKAGRLQLEPSTGRLTPAPPIDLGQTAARLQQAQSQLGGAQPAQQGLGGGLPGLGGGGGFEFSAKVTDPRTGAVFTIKQPSADLDPFQMFFLQQQGLLPFFFPGAGGQQQAGAAPSVQPQPASAGFRPVPGAITAPRQVLEEPVTSPAALSPGPLLRPQQGPVVTGLKAGGVTATLDPQGIISGQQQAGEAEIEAASKLVRGLRRFLTIAAQGVESRASVGFPPAQRVFGPIQRFGAQRGLSNQELLSVIKLRPVELKLALREIGENARVPAEILNEVEGAFDLENVTDAEATDRIVKFLEFIFAGLGDVAKPIVFSQPDIQELVQNLGIRTDLGEFSGIFRNLGARTGRGGKIKVRVGGQLIDADIIGVQ